MIPNKFEISNVNNSIPRHTFINILKVSLKKKNYKFARQASKEWLSVFPGDLEIKLYYAKALFFEGNLKDTTTVIEKLILSDPEYLEAYETLGMAYNDGISENYLNAMASIYALGGSISKDIALPRWCKVIREFNQELKNKENDSLAGLYHKLIGLNSGIQLVDLFHLKAVYEQNENDNKNLMQLANLYHARYPECIQFLLILADCRLNAGDGPGAVSLLHQCVAQDTAGQVVTRLWGKDNKYKDLWLDKLEVNLSLAIPAGIMEVFGWNRLCMGENKSQANSNVTMSVEPINENNQHLKKLNEEEGNIGALDSYTQTKDNNPAVISERIIEKSPSSEEKVFPDSDITNCDVNHDTKPQKNPKEKTTRTHLDTGLKSIEQVFHRLSKLYKRADIPNNDSRYPMYIVFSSRRNLIEKYGPQTFEILNGEMNRLALSINKRPDWGALVFYPDDLECAAKHGVSPVDIIDPWKLKLSLADLDKSLAKKGEMIGALLIIGGPDVIPFHKLPNPTFDSDKDVCSDNPYSTLDSNYFVPEWITGRFPGEASSDPGILLEQIRQAINYHNKKVNIIPWWERFFFPFDILLGNVWEIISSKAGKFKFDNMGYTAAIWRRSSIAVYRQLGEASALMVSPPAEAEQLNTQKITNVNFGYYNLHGVEDGANWYGQGDIINSQICQDYPVALRPIDLKKNGRAPQTVFTEACYGTNVNNKSIEDAISLKFISIGTNTIVGSTCIAYGSVKTPLIGADLLGYLFWKYLGEGHTVGDSLLKAKFELVKEMNRRQGYLDGEDQKTLISFVLYGDPLARFGEVRKVEKGFKRNLLQQQVKTITDFDGEIKISKRVSRQALCEVKKALEPYLPGIEEAEVKIKPQYMVDNINITKKCRQEINKLQENHETGNIVVSISKHIQLAHQSHHHFARVTLDSHGKMVKLAISR